MNLDIFSSWTYAQAQATEDAVLERARERGRELGVESVGVATGGFLTVLAAISGARNLVEIGTGVGISGTCLLRGAGKHAALTTIDIDVDHLAAAREAFHDAGFDSSRTRAISGRAQTVLPRLTDGAYDLVFIDADKAHLLEYTTQAIRLVRIGGLVVMHDAFDQHRVPKPALRQTSTVATRNANRMLRDDERFVSTIVPTGLGLHLAARVS
ncbi:O-methyltransferase [Paeniglutamicibacter gangotriensis]|uniref:O-methyltransferase n=2 Tax=Paeniglutamicibacter gangotriensis TaxID=254787 RepID=M7MT99_9MICC|nr:O-methyltransferase [Paeniglutamicibacter gangotriensis]EMQ99642.1 O-methyltransferase [Paeniglutamicibacter gangotriensis Lz1y]KAA0977984.1 O-methyltransferase [Paeniglutamicibacter gangotriensis]